MTKTRTTVSKKTASKQRTLEELDGRASAARTAARDAKQHLRGIKDNYKHARKQFKAAKKASKLAEKIAAKAAKELRAALKDLDVPKRKNPVKKQVTERSGVGKDQRVKAKIVRNRKVGTNARAVKVKAEPAPVDRATSDKVANESAVAE